MAVVRRINDIELSQIAKLEQDMFTDPWSEGSLKSTKDSDHGNIIISVDEESREIKAYLIYYCMGDEIELARIATCSDYRGQGYGFGLMNYLQEKAITDEKERILLEVREGNATAIALYEKCGFQSIGIRKNYYTSPEEDGNIMEKVL